MDHIKESHERLREKNDDVRHMIFCGWCNSELWFSEEELEEALIIVCGKCGGSIHKEDGTWCKLIRGEDKSQCAYCSEEFEAPESSPDITICPNCGESNTKDKDGYWIRAD